MSKARSKKIRNPVVWWLMVSFLVMTLIISAIACYFAYRQKSSEILTKLDMQLLQVGNEYESITKDFWEIYLPLFEETENSKLLKKYFLPEKEGDLDPFEKLRISRVLSNMAVRDESIQWIAIYSPHREINYVYLPMGSSLQQIPEDFPYLEDLRQKNIRMEIYPKEEVVIGEYRYESIAITGGTTGRMRDGSIIVGYSVEPLEQLCRKEGDIQSLRFDVWQQDKVIFSSEEDEAKKLDMELADSGIYKLAGEKWYVRVLEKTMRGARVSYAVRWQEIWMNALGNIAGILGVALCTAMAAIAVYLLTLRSLTREVNIIRNGLDILGRNQLDYRIEEKFYQPELGAISEAVNRMAGSLKENSERAREYEQRQIHSELQELQAKFNPHFLYNSLEIFRARCYENGDEETAELIAQTASIFRGFIGSRTFIPIPEELAFGKRYLALFRARYGDSVRVLYDIDAPVQEYGIIRNVFQPLIENYFEHGYDPANEDNYILFRGRIRDGETILFTIEDNGLGMEDEALLELNRRLQQPILQEKESYGLKNLHQRLRLFYGGECGLTVRRGEEKGLIIEMIIKRQKAEEIT